MPASPPAQDPLTAFLKARLDEDEAAAERLREHLEVSRRGGAWGSSQPMSGNSVTIVTAWMPERIDREVDAKRAIVDEYEKAEREADRLNAPGFAEPDDAVAWRLALEMACKHLAAVYRDHPDYRQEWKP